MEPGIPRWRWHRRVFLAAGVYNICWGLFAAAEPQWLFRFSGMPELNHPQIYSCLGMVIGLYGLLYLEVARMPARGWLLAAVGLAGKILGPMGMFYLIYQGIWPLRAAILCLTNDLIWWIPFAVYLCDSWKPFRESFRQAEC